MAGKRPLTDHWNGSFDESEGKNGWVQRSSVLNELYSPNKQAIMLLNVVYDIPVACMMLGVAQFFNSVAARGALPVGFAIELVQL